MHVSLCTLQSSHKSYSVITFYSFRRNNFHSLSTIELNSWGSSRQSDWIIWSCDPQCFMGWIPWYVCISSYVHAWVCVCVYMTFCVSCVRVCDACHGFCLIAKFLIITDDTHFDHFIVTVAPYYATTVTNKRCGCNTWSRTIPRVSASATFWISACAILNFDIWPKRQG